jgi:glycerol-3-phosphate dehydrogenase
VSSESEPDLVAFAVPTTELAAAVAAHGPRISKRTGVLVAAHGLVPPGGTPPSTFAAQRTDAWAVGVLGLPPDPAGFLDGNAAVVVASADAGFARQVELALRAAKLRVRRSADVTAVERESSARAAVGPDPELTAL